MDHRAPLPTTQRPRAPQRALSGGSYASHQLPKYPPPPSRLSSVRSASQPVNVVDLTAEWADGEKKNVAAFIGNGEKRVVSSPGVMDSEHGDGEPPVKKVKREREGFRSVKDETDQANTIVPGSPLPSLPKTKPALKRIAVPRRQRFGIDPPARKAHGFDPPAAATRVPSPKKVLDFTPWTGGQQEDVLTETVIKSGYFDKPQGTNQTESNSAKASIWPNLSQKNHHGLSMLGYLFMGVMEKRQSIGRCTAPSTFKPPPRVTVTDTKREAWLRDLANPEVPLRKQSRTIPHGIRGKLLMEQCLSKTIPIHRAVWLAKCVGANELRAFRRKGVSGSAAVGGETKWVKEWTIHVEQFLEGVISTCGQKDWQKNMNYALKLATAFFAEKLLDNDHYLDWVVSSLAESTLERLPIWIVMAQIYWKDIIAYGKRGRKLAEGILEHLHQITISQSDVNAALKVRLQRLVAVLAVSNAGCLIIPQSWERYNHLLSPGTGAIDVSASNIVKRNERLAAPLCKTSANTRSTLLALYGELDSVGLDVNIERLADTFSTLLPDTSNLVTAVLDWASTLYRTGVPRIYLAASLIAHFHGIGADTDSIILQYLNERRDATATDTGNIHKVIAELVFLASFSVGRYLQWLITSGVLSTGNEVNCATGLIAALPTEGLPLHVLNTRKTLMRRLEYDIREGEKVEEVLAGIDDYMAGLSMERVELPGRLTMSSKLTISQRTSTKLSSTKDAGISLEAFTVARDVIERVGDFRSLAALVTAASTTENSALLATVVDTINLHAETFAAIGNLKSIVEGLTQHYINHRAQQPPDRTLILALTALANCLPDQSSFAKLLTDDLAICEQQNSLAVCSPASDSLIGMHASSLDSDDDIDAVFASGNTMDEQLMHRVFMRIIQRAGKSLARNDESASRVGSWLIQLRAVDGSGVFDRIVQHYLLALLKGASDEALSTTAIESLVASGSIALANVADMAKEVKSPEVATSLLEMFLSDEVANEGLSDCEKYRFCLQQERCRAGHPDSLGVLIHTACDAHDFHAEDPNLLHFMIRSSTSRPGSIRRVFEGDQHSETLVANTSRMVNAILRHDLPAEHQTGSLDVQALVTAATPFNIRYCMEAIKYITSVRTWTVEDDERLGSAILEAFRSQSEVWAQLLEIAGEAVNRRMYEWAQEELLSMVKTAVSEDEHLRRCLELLATTSNAANLHDNTSVINSLTDHFKDLQSQLSDPNKSFDPSSREALATCHRHLRILLDLTVMHIHSIPNESDASQKSRSALLSSLLSLQQQPHNTYLADLTSVLSDNLPPTTNPPTPSAPEPWLALASQPPAGSSQQQRALNNRQSRRPGGGGGGAEAKVITPFHQLRRWEVLSDSAPVVGENDGCLSLGLFGGRKV